MACTICGDINTHDEAICENCLERARRVPLYATMVSELGQPRNTRLGRALWPCPFHAEATVGAFHWFADGEKHGFKCLSCGVGGGDAIAFIRALRRLTFTEAVQYLLGASPHSAPPSPTPAAAPQERSFPSWLENAATITAQQQGHPKRYARWYTYRRLDPATVDRYGLGVGALPWSHCHHERLTMPLSYNGAVVGLRGRALDCDCEKWLSSSPHPAHTKFLYNAPTLRQARGCLLYITENPADALLLEQRYHQHGVRAVATLGVTMWRDAWTRWIAAAQPAEVILAYDNDAAGMPNAEQRRTAFAMAQERGLPEPHFPGLKLFNTLRAGLRCPVTWLDWQDAAAKLDIGAVLMR